MSGFVHCFNMFGKDIALDVNSGAFYEVSPICAYIINAIGTSFPNDGDNALETSLLTDLMATAIDDGVIVAKNNDNQPQNTENYDEASFKEAFAEIMDLKNDGLLWSGDDYESVVLKSPKKSEIKAICLHIAHDCNLRCKYCFANKGDFKGEKGLMTADVGKKAIDFVINSSGKRRNIEIDFFGGEPLLAFGVVKKIVEYANEEGKKHDKIFRFTITTNGMLLDDEKIDYINKNMSNIVLSIDGRKKVNDDNRQRLDGTGCYDTIIPKYLKVAESRKQDNYYVRGTFTADNLDFAEDVLHLADLGFMQVSVEPVVSDENESYAIKEEHLPKIFSEYERLAKEYIDRKKSGNGFNFFHFMIDLEGGPCVYKRVCGCGAGHEYVAVTPNGDIFPCHQFADKPEFKMGNVLTGEFNDDSKKAFEGNNIYTKEKCKSCFAKFYCSGGCVANAYSYGGGMDKPHHISCEMQKKRVECALYILSESL